MAKARKRTNADLWSVADSVLEAVPRADLIALLRACATADVCGFPWSSDTVAMDRNRWSRIESTALRCLQAIPKEQLK